MIARLVAAAALAGLLASAWSAAAEPRTVIPWLRGEEQAAPAPVAPDPANPAPVNPAPNSPAPGDPLPGGAPQIGAPNPAAPAGPANAAAPDPNDGLQTVPPFGPAGPNDPAAVEVAALGEVGVGAAGTLSPEAVGLPRDAWRGTDAETAIALIDRTAPSDLRAANALAVRLLSAALTPPSDGARVFNARIAALSRFGASEAAARIGETAGVETAAQQPAWRAASLASGRDVIFCDAVVNGEAPASDVETIYCRARMGDAPAALLSIQTLRSLGGEDPLTLDLLEAVADPGYAEFVPPIESGAEISPVELAALRISALPLPTGYGETAPLALLGPALTEEAAPRERLSAVERLEAAGALDTSDLRDAFDAAASAESGGVWGRVEAYRATRVVSATARFAAASEALKRAKESDREAQMARLLAPSVERASAQLGGRDEPIARRILRFDARMGAASALTPAAAGAEERGLDRIAYPEGATQWTAQDAAPLLAKAARGDQAAGRLLAALNAFEIPTPDPAFFPISEELSFKLAEQRRAEIAFEALGYLRTGSAAPPNQLYAALRALRALDLEEEARMIAVEAVLLGG